MPQHSEGKSLGADSSLLTRVLAYSKTRASAIRYSGTHGQPVAMPDKYSFVSKRSRSRPSQTFIPKSMRIASPPTKDKLELILDFTSQGRHHTCTSARPCELRNLLISAASKVNTRRLARRITDMYSLATRILRKQGALTHANRQVY